MDEYAEERKKNNEDQSYMIPRKEGHAANNEDQGYMIPRKEEDAAMEMKVFFSFLNYNHFYLFRQN